MKFLSDSSAEIQISINNFHIILKLKFSEFKSELKYFTLKITCGQYNNNIVIDEKSPIIFGFIALAINKEYFKKELELGPIYYHLYEIYGRIGLKVDKKSLVKYFNALKEEVKELTNSGRNTGFNYGSYGGNTIYGNYNNISYNSGININNNYSSNFSSFAANGNAANNIVSSNIANNIVSSNIANNIVSSNYSGGNIYNNNYNNNLSNDKDYYAGRFQFYY